MSVCISVLCRHCSYAFSCPSYQSYGVFHLVICQTTLKMVQPAFWTSVLCPVVSYSLFIIISFLYILIVSKKDICRHAHVHANASTHTPALTCTWTHVCRHTHAHINKHLHTHPCIYMHMHPHSCVCFCINISGNLCLDVYIKFEVLTMLMHYTVIRIYKEAFLSCSNNASHNECVFMPDIKLINILSESWYEQHEWGLY